MQKASPSAAGNEFKVWLFGRLSSPESSLFLQKTLYNHWIFIGQHYKDDAAEKETNYKKKGREGFQWKLKQKYPYNSFIATYNMLHICLYINIFKYIYIYMGNVFDGTHWFILSRISTGNAAVSPAACAWGFIKTTALHHG